MIKTKKISIANVSRSVKSTFKTKTENYIDKKRIIDKNNNWKVLGKPYNQFVFVSVSIKNYCLFLNKTIKSVLYGQYIKNIKSYLYFVEKN